MKYIAFIVKGLEKIVQREIEHSIADAMIISMGDKRIIFESDDMENVLKLRTVDDICLYVNSQDSIKNTNDFVEFLQRIDFKQAALAIQNLRSNNHSFSITASLASSPLKPTEVIQIIEHLIAKEYSWTYTERDHTNFDIRVFIDHQDAIIGIRITPESLHHRLYKQFEKTGSLRPTVAAAMVMLATNLQSELTIVDNFCGSGTILCEAALQGETVSGGDIDAESVENTKKNLINPGNKGPQVVVQNAMQTSWRDQCFDAAISNLPWDKQIKVDSITTLFENSIREYARILKPTGSICLLVAKPDLCIKYMKKYFPEKKIASYKLGLLGQTPTIVVGS